jgi:hypothetical protein
LTTLVYARWGLSFIHFFIRINSPD